MRQPVSDHPSPRGGPTFLIKIHYRQNASWQGSIQWLEINCTRFFRSYLELIFLMEEAMDKTATPSATYKFNSWDDPKQANR